ncbi:hypothetical protein D9M73_140490 [compost metagenome]
MEEELRQCPVADVVCGRKVEHDSLRQRMGDRRRRIDDQGVCHGLLHDRQRLGNARLRLCDRARAFARIAPFAQQHRERLRKRFAAQPIDALLRLHTGKAHLRGQREHVRCEPRRHQCIRRAAWHLPLGLGQPSRQRVQHLGVGGKQHIGEGHDHLSIRCAGILADIALYAWRNEPATAVSASSRCYFRPNSFSMSPCASLTQVGRP